MTIHRTTLLGLLFFISGLTFGQKVDSASVKIIGKWLLVKHTVTVNGETIDRLSADQIYTYDFLKDGTYKVMYADKNYKGATGAKGNWKISDNGKTIHFFKNVLEPKDPKAIVGDHDLPIIKLTKTEFVTQEYLFTETPVGTSYYKKQ